MKCQSASKPNDQREEEIDGSDQEDQIIHISQRGRHQGLLLQEAVKVVVRGHSLEAAELEDMVTDQATLRS